jgi:hypothetical protein
MFCVKCYFGVFGNISDIPARRIGAIYRTLHWISFGFQNIFDLAIAIIVVNGYYAWFILLHKNYYNIHFRSYER